MRQWLLSTVTGLGLMTAGAGAAGAAGELLLVSGRWDNTVLVVDLAKAMEAGNDGTSNAIINSVRVTPDVNGTAASGQPVNVVLSPDGQRAYVVNHSGTVTTEAAGHFQHGHPGTVTVLDVAKALDPVHK